MEELQTATPLHWSGAEHFEAWRTAPLDPGTGDPRFECGRASVSEFERIFDLVDAAFGTRRPRELYDWMYRKNPRGPARCWTVTDRETGELIGSNARFPWPLNRGATPIDGYICGDQATAPAWQGKGIFGLIQRACVTHPESSLEAVFSWPNPKSIRGLENAGKAHVATLPDALPARALPLHWKRGLPLPARLRPIALGATNRLLRAWPELALRGPGPIRTEEVRRFDASVDQLASKSDFFPGFWCPRNAEFLNWRYLDHPKRHYVATVALDGERPLGYGVLKLKAGRATVMELTTSVDAPHAARALLLQQIRTARAAGCSSLDCVATGAFQPWRLLRRAGFLRVESDVRMSVRGRAPGLRALDNWRLGPGDIDSL